MLSSLVSAPVLFQLLFWKKGFSLTSRLFESVYWFGFRLIFQADANSKLPQLLILPVSWSANLYISLAPV